jgi:hypothetical protein
VFSWGTHTQAPRLVHLQEQSGGCPGEAAGQPEVICLNKTHFLSQSVFPDRISLLAAARAVLGLKGDFLDCLQHDRPSLAIDPR